MPSPGRAVDAPVPTGDRLAAAYLLGIADDAMVYAQRLGEWLTNAPQIEEDMALANVSLDLLGQARGLYAHIGELDGTLRSEDDFAMLRDEREWRNVHLVEQERQDFGFEMARLLWFSAYQNLLYGLVAAGSSDETFRAVGEKAAKEVRYHLDHAHQWVNRLGDGTEESRTGCRRRSSAVLPLRGRAVRRRPGQRGRGRRGARRATVGARGRTSTAPSWRIVSEATLELPRRLALAVTRRASGRPLGADGVPPRRDAARRPVAPGGDVVTTTRTAPGELRAAVGSIPDPEVPVVTIADLGILRSVAADETTGVVDVVITPTYSGCPAMEAITAHVSFVCRAAGWEPRVTHPAEPGLDHRLDVGRRQGEAAPVRDRAAHAYPGWWSGPRRAGAADRRLSPLRFGRHRGARAVRVDGVQGAPAL